MVQVRKGEKWHRPSACFPHTRRELKKGNTGEETPPAAPMVLHSLFARSLLWFLLFQLTSDDASQTLEFHIISFWSGWLVSPPFPRISLWNATNPQVVCRSLVFCSDFVQYNRTSKISGLKNPTWCTCLETPEKFRAYFGCHDFLCILKIKTFPGMTFCNTFALSYLEIRKRRAC